MTTFSKSDAELAARILRPEYLPSDFLSYTIDYYAINSPPVPVSNVIGAGFYARQLDITAEQLEVVSSAAETTIYTTDVQANTLGTDGLLQLILNGDYINNSAANRTFILKVKYGATTVYQDTSPSLGSDTDITTAYIRIELAAANATNAQNMFGRVEFAGRTATPTTGIGPLSTIVPSVAATIGGSASEDSTKTKTLAVTFQHSASHASLSYRRKFAVLTKIGH